MNVKALQLPGPGYDKELKSRVVQEESTGRPSDFVAQCPSTATLPEVFVGKSTAFPAPLNVCLQDDKDK